jgi:hypothetical protein
MPPIFPGMDPYLESAGVWPGFHERFLSYACEALQPRLPQRYYADLQTREEIGIGGVFEGRVVHPDVAVKWTALDRGGSPDGGGPAAPGAAAIPEILTLSQDEAVRAGYIEVRESAASGRLVTLIEVLSPWNKHPGPDRDSFERKQREILSSDVHWVEIDLLREGRRIACDPRVDVYCRRKSYDYLVAVSRSERRSPRLQLELYGFTVRDPLPAVAIPLIAPDPDVSLPLGQVFLRAYETGPYHKTIRYDLPPERPLAPGDADWARELVAKRGSAG